MTGGSGGKATRAAQRALGGGTGMPTGTGLRPSSPLRVACPKCSAGAGRKCVKVDRYGMESARSGSHPERITAARAARR